MFHLKLKDTLKHSIATVTSHMDSFVYNPGRDYSRIRKLSPDHVISFLISQGASSTKCEFLGFLSNVRGSPFYICPKSKAFPNDARGSGSCIP